MFFLVCANILLKVYYVRLVCFIQLKGHISNTSPPSAHQLEWILIAAYLFFDFLITKQMPRLPPLSDQCLFFFKYLHALSVDACLLVVEFNPSVLGHSIKLMCWIKFNGQICVCTGCLQTNYLVRYPISANCRSRRLFGFTTAFWSFFLVLVLLYY